MHVKNGFWKTKAHLDLKPEKKKMKIILLFSLLFTLFFCEVNSQYGTPYASAASPTLYTSGSVSLYNHFENMLIFQGWNERSKRSLILLTDVDEIIETLSGFTAK